MVNAPTNMADLTVLVEIWKKTVDVQQHFNTIEMQIRSLAVTVLTGTIAVAAATASKYSMDSSVGSDQTLGLYLWRVHFTPADVMVVGGLLAWGSFYCMDRWWYHRLLKAAVERGEALEKSLAEIDGVGMAGLTSHISSKSPIRFKGISIHSQHKIDIFYSVVAAALLFLIAYVF